MFTHLAHNVCGLLPKRFGNPVAALVLTVMLATLMVGCAGESNDPGPATLQDVLNVTLVQVPGRDKTEAGIEGMGIPVGTWIATQRSSLAGIAFANRALIRLQAESRLGLLEPQDTETIRLVLEEGNTQLALAGFPTRLDTAIAHVLLNGFAEAQYESRSVAEDIGDDIFTLRCYTGPCVVESIRGHTVLSNLEQATISQLGSQLTLSTLSQIDVQLFIANNPGSAGMISTLTAMPSRTPTSTASPSSTPTKPTATATSTPTRTHTATNTATATSTPTRRPPTIPPVIENTNTALSGYPTPIEPTASSGVGDPPPKQNPTSTIYPTAVPAIPTNTPVPSDTPRPSATP